MARDIDVGLIRTFLAVAETGGMTQAAQTLNLTQGAVSQQIKRLESLFDKQLFDRSNKNMRLTADGEKLIVSAQRFLTLNDEVWHLMTEPPFSGEVRLGVPPDIVGLFLPAVLRQFCREYPRVRVTLVSDSTPILLESLRRNDIDLTLTTEAERGRGDELLFSDQLVWVGAKGGEAAHRSPLPIALGSESCAFNEPTRHALNRANIDWCPVVQVGGLEAIITSLEADMAVAAYLSQAVPSPLKVVDSNVGLPKLPRYHVNLRSSSVERNPIADELARYIKMATQNRYIAA